MKIVKRGKSNDWPFAFLGEDFDRFFDFDRSPTREALWAPAIDASEEGDQIVIKADLPGLDKEAINLSLENGVLTISGERKEEKRTGEGKNLRLERYVGRFARSLSLPAHVDPSTVKATYNDGVLTVEVSKLEHAKSKQIEIE